MKHAIAVSENGGTVRVAASVVHDELQLEISDTGPGMNTAEAGQRRGVGLRNTLHRLETLYEGRYTFETIENSASGLLTRIRTPFQVEPLTSDKSSVSR